MSILHSIFKKKVSRSVGGDIILILFLSLMGILMILPFVYTISTSLKPANELWLFPPRFFVIKPTLKNFSDLFSLMADSWIPFSRYIFNTVFITAAGTALHIILASMCAYPLSRYKFPGSKFIFSMIQTTLMFSAAVTAIPSFIIMSKLHLIDTYAAVILPAVGAPLGLFIMKQFMDQTVNLSVLESADMDGAGEVVKFFKLVMPMAKPAWITLMIFTVQSLWGLGSSAYIFSEQLKTLSYALSQVQAAGIARAGVGGAITVLMMLVPLIVFIVSQSNVIETMSTSGMKD
ncbi:MAG: carbohydrate ABC transporter permease [Clostridiales bacterium]|nr:carbohydrate ABC transporter permease [Clostridiales bacterium]